MRRHQQAITAISMLSGAAGLTYEVFWSRELVLIFGSVIGGRSADGLRSAHRPCAGLELLLVVVVLVTPVLFGAIRRANGWAYSMFVQDHVIHVRRP